MDAQSQPPPIPGPPPKRKGCFFYGCLTCLILFVLLAAGIYFGVKLFVNRTNELARDYTDTQPSLLPRVERSTNETARVKKLVGDFFEGLNHGTNPPSLTLTSDELNDMVSGTAEDQGFPGQIRLTINDGKIKGQVSAPLDAIKKNPFVDLKGRYLNGSATAFLTLTNGVLWLRVDSFEAHGKSLPPFLREMLEGPNLAQGFQTSSPENEAAIDRLESVQVIGDKIILTAKERK